MILVKPIRDNEDNNCEICGKLFLECNKCFNLICDCEFGCSCGELICGQLNTCNL